jgi:hypothetical protein
LTTEEVAARFGDGSYEFVFDFDDQDDRYDRYPYVSSAHMIFDAMLVAPDARAIFFRSNKTSVVFEDVNRIVEESSSEIGTVLALVCKRFNREEMMFRVWVRKKTG